MKTRKIILNTVWIKLRVELRYSWTTTFHEGEIIYAHNIESKECVLFCNKIILTKIQ
jgi:hypothetical protein